MRGLVVLIVALVLIATAQATTPLQQRETATFCNIVLPQIAGPAIRVRRCRFVRYDRSATEDLFRVWFTHRGSVYTICLWSSLNTETTPEHVVRIGVLGHTLC